MLEPDSEQREEMSWMEPMQWQKKDDLDPTEFYLLSLFFIFIKQLAQNESIRGVENVSMCEPL